MSKLQRGHDSGSPPYIHALPSTEKIIFETYIQIDQSSETAEKPCFWDEAVTVSKKQGFLIT